MIVSPNQKLSGGFLIALITLVDACKHALSVLTDCP